MQCIFTQNLLQNVSDFNHRSDAIILLQFFSNVFSGKLLFFLVETLWNLVLLKLVRLRRDFLTSFIFIDKCENVCLWADLLSVGAVLCDFNTIGLNVCDKFLQTIFDEVYSWLFVLLDAFQVLDVGFWQLWNDMI